MLFSHFSNYPDWRCACVTYDDCGDYDPGDHTWLGQSKQSPASDWLSSSVPGLWLADGLESVNNLDSGPPH